MRVIPEIAYLPEAGERGVGDLYLPDREPADAPVALTIHGGGWNALDKSSFAGVAEFLCKQGFAVFNINYRLLNAGPWPLCGDDCLKAADFLLNGTVPELAGFDCGRILAAGASAGGHLALMTGLRLPPERVRGIISLSGVDDLTLYPESDAHRKLFFGREPDAGMIAAANPVSLIRKDQPPVLCTHTVYDTVVSFEAAERFVAECRKAGARVEFFRYDRSGDGHCLWIPGSSPHRLLPELEHAVSEFLSAYGIGGRTE